MQELRSQDLNFILTRIPRDIRSLVEKNPGVVIAGILREIDPLYIVDGVDFIEDEEHNR